eukprot:m.241787 g.241787  ORF g.241787 m.241787 type:complete len:326 (+) comp15328_c0_seq5:128-1105(+)
MSTTTTTSKQWLRLAVNVASWAPTESVFRRALSCIQQEEQARILRFVFIDDAKSSLVGRLLMRYAVQELTGTQHEECKFERTDRGKPLLAAPSLPLLFNVSHAGDYAVMAATTTPNPSHTANPQTQPSVARDHSPGIDSDSAEVEQDMAFSSRDSQLLGVDVMDKRKPNAVESVPAYFDLMRKQFTPDEWTRIEHPSKSHDAQLLEFYRYWCLKESYIKAVGIGLGMDLQRLSFVADSALNASNTHVCAAATVTIDGTLRRDWMFEQQHLDERHCVALARNFEATPQPFTFLSVEDLLCTLEPHFAVHEAAASKFPSFRQKIKRL